jgi:hypothetical protein
MLRAAITTGSTAGDVPRSVTYGVGQLRTAAGATRVGVPVNRRAPFDDEQVWTSENLALLYHNVIEAPLEDDRSFLETLLSRQNANGLQPRD